MAVMVYVGDVTLINTRAANYGNQPHITARSLLVTVFGDSIAPAGGEIWIGDLIKLIEPFSFSDRLIRTSVFRLGEEGWFTTERIGRRSKYSLSATARQEFEAADRRIYYPPSSDWDGAWTIVFANDSDLDDTTKAALARALKWHGFGRVASGVFASPSGGPDAVAAAASQVGVDLTLPTARAEFDDVSSLVGRDSFAADFGIDESGAAYDRFLGDWAWFTDADTDDGHAAFLIRSMLIHDYRRVRLADPELPVSLLPKRWAGTSAHNRAAEIFHAVNATTNEYLNTTWGLDTQPNNRFPKA